jgi:glycosyltransferase involved in cell wall biosynthesis
MADLIVTLTEYVKTEIETQFSLQKKKIAVIPHGDMSFIFNQVRTKNTKIYNEPTIAFIGSISPYKGLMFLLDVFNLIVQKMDARLLILGVQNESITKYYDWADKLNIYEKIIWEIGYTPLDELYYKIKNVNLFIFTYTRASQSGGIITAFTLNKPVIVRPVGGLTEMIHENRDGLVAAGRQEMADKIVNLLTDENKYTSMIKYIKSRRRAQNNWNSICAKFVSQYSELLA